MDSTAGAGVALSLESAQFAFEKQLESTLSDISAKAEFSETVPEELGWRAYMSGFSRLFGCSLAFFLNSERRLGLPTADLLNSEKEAPAKDIDLSGAETSFLLVSQGEIPPHLEGKFPPFPYTQNPSGCLFYSLDTSWCCSRHSLGTETRDGHLQKSTWCSAFP